MSNVAYVYDSLADMLAYPDDRMADRIECCRNALARDHWDAWKLVNHFAHRLDGLGTGQLQELYTQTFDLNPVCSLEVGWQLFGENYSRGEFLAEMRGTLRRLGVPEGTELPDHLTHVLPALGRMAARDATRFAARHLLPALEKMLQGLRDKDCPFEDVLEAIRTVVLSPYGVAPSPEPLPQVEGEGRVRREVAHG